MVHPECTVTGVVKEKMYTQFVGNSVYIIFLDRSTCVCNIRNCKPELKPENRDGDTCVMCMAIAGMNSSEMV